MMSSLGGRAAVVGVRPNVRQRIGLVTDLHFADKNPGKSRFYRESGPKLNEAIQWFHQEKVARVVELGDLIDAADSVDVELGYLETIRALWSKAPGEKHFVLGNHCVDMLTKDEFLGGVGAKESFGSFDEGGFHFIILDACFRHDGKPYGRKNAQWTDPNIPGFEVEWLKDDLAKTNLPVVVLVHQRLDVGKPYGVKNAEEVRKVLESAGNVRLVLQGHSHKNDYHEINRIHYVTLVAMVEGSGLANSGAAILNLHENGALSLVGHRRQKAYQWA